MGTPLQRDRAGSPPTRARPLRHTEAKRPGNGAAPASGAISPVSAQWGMSARDLATAVLLLTVAGASVGPVRAGQPAEARRLPIESAQHLFYTSRYTVAADQALQLINETPTDLAAFELRTSALHFQIRRAMGNAKDRKAALAACGSCPALLEVFLAEIGRGRAAAKARLVEAPADEQAMYYLAKIDLSYLWMQLSTLGKRTGWDEYWESKRLLETVLKNNPSHLRARVAQAWMDYIVGSRVPWGTRWLMGGGNKDRGVRAMRNAAAAPGDFYSEVEADFALWEMLVREGKRAEALPIAKDLLAKFPENEDLAKLVSGG